VGKSFQPAPRGFQRRSSVTKLQRQSFYKQCPKSSCRKVINIFWTADARDTYLLSRTQFALPLLPSFCVSLEILGYVASTFSLADRVNISTVVHKVSKYTPRGVQTLTGLFVRSRLRDPLVVNARRTPEETRETLFFFCD
jgi:hypothetical protein